MLKRLITCLKTITIDIETDMEAVQGAIDLCKNEIMIVLAINQFLVRIRITRITQITKIDLIDILRIMFQEMIDMEAVDTVMVGKMDTIIGQDRIITVARVAREKIIADKAITIVMPEVIIMHKKRHHSHRHHGANQLIIRTIVGSNQLMMVTCMSRIKVGIIISNLMVRIRINLGTTLVQKVAMINTEVSTKIFHTTIISKVVAIHIIITTNVIMVKVVGVLMAIISNVIPNLATKGIRARTFIENVSKKVF